jgi:hypothetical protein
MPSNYPQFDVAYDLANGLRVGLLADHTIHVHDATNDVPLGDVVSNAEGIVEAGTLPVDAGTTVRFYSDHLGAAGAIEFVTIP